MTLRLASLAQGRARLASLRARTKWAARSLTLLTGVLTRGLLIAATLLGLAVRVPAVDADRSLNSIAPAAQAPAPVTLTLRIAGDRRQFHPGEIIPIELTFESSIPGRFVVDGATSDRSGRLTIDEFDLAPLARVTDPMLDYFASYGAFMGGGLRGIGVLGSEPYAVRLDLNDWFRFDSPGTFTLSVRSTRVTDEAQRTPSSRPPVVPVESNVVSFEIVPRETRWEEAEFARAVQMLGERSDDHARGCRVLMFLGTHAAVDELIRRHDDGECRYELTAGVFGAPDRVYALGRLDAGLRAPDQVITSEYLRTLALLAIYVRRPELRPPQTAETKSHMIDGELAQHPEIVDAEEAKYAAVLASALPSKSARARAVSTQEYARFVNLRSSSSTGAVASDNARRQVIASFRDLPTTRQENLLEFDWPAVADADMIPVLRELADGSNRLANLALRRLYALSPEEGRARILREIANPKPSASLRTLGILPDTTLPELDETIAQAVEANVTEIGIALLYRYASPAIAPRMRLRLGDRIGRLACQPQTHALAFFLRAAPRDGAALLERALVSRDGTGCFRSVLLDTASLQMTPELEATARAHLDDSDPRVVLSAVDTLGRYGSPAAIPSLQAAFERWRRQWAERLNVLRFNLAQRTETSAAVQGMIEMAYVRALGPGALVGGPAIADPHELCITDDCRVMVPGSTTDDQYTTIVVTGFDNARDLFATLSGYEFRSLASLERKLAQYRQGTRLRMRIQIANLDHAQATASELAAWAAAHGLELAP
jgi:hypothetical protein